MARERERRGRAAERQREERQMQRIYIGVGAVLAIAAVLIVIGLYVTNYQPPRAHVVTVEGRSYQARDIVDRGIYLAFFEGGAGNIADLARDSIDAVLEEEALRLRAPALVGEVTAEDIQHELNIELGLIEDDPAPVGDGEPTPEPGATGAATASPTPEATSTTEPTTEPTADATVDPQEFADALTTFLRSAGLERDEYESIIEARLYRERLRDYFEAELSASGPQIRLQRIRVSTQLAANTVLEELEAGADFATLAEEQSVAPDAADGGEIGWTVADLQTDDVQAAIAGLEAGEWSESIAVGLFFEIYRVAEVAEDREYDEPVILQLTGLRLDDWLEEAIASLEVDENLSADEETWINERVLAGVTSRLGG